MLYNAKYLDNWKDISYWETPYMYFIQDHTLRHHYSANILSCLKFHPMVSFEEGYNLGKDEELLGNISICCKSIRKMHLEWKYQTIFCQISPLKLHDEGLILDFNSWSFSSPVFWTKVTISQIFHTLKC